MLRRLASLLLLGALLPACPDSPPPPDEDPNDASFAGASDLMLRRAVAAANGQDASVARWLIDRIAAFPPSCPGSEISRDGDVMHLDMPDGCPTSAGWSARGKADYSFPFDLAGDGDIDFESFVVDGPLADDTITIDGSVSWTYDADFERTTYIDLTVTRAGIAVHSTMITHTGDDPSIEDGTIVAGGLGTATVSRDGDAIVLQGAERAVFTAVPGGCGSLAIDGAAAREVCLYRAAPSRFEDNDIRSVSAVCEGSTTKIEVDTLEPQISTVRLVLGFSGFELNQATANADGGYTYTITDEAQCLSLPGNDYAVHQFGSLGVSTLAEYLVEPPVSWGT